MLASLKAAVRRDASFDLPANYATGSGDTHFSGKQVAKLARIGLIAAALADLEHDDDKYDNTTARPAIRRRWTASQRRSRGGCGATSRPGSRARTATRCSSTPRRYRRRGEKESRGK